MRGLGAILGLFCGIAPALAQGKGHGVEVRALTLQLIDVSPGHIVSLSFLVTSRSAQEEEFIERVDLPQGWQLVTPPGSFPLVPGEATTRLVAIQVPRGTPAGRYEVSYGVRSQRDYAIQDADAVVIVVGAVARLALMVEEKPESVLAGERYEVKLRLINQSNVALAVRTEVLSAAKYPATIEPTEVALGVGESTILVVRVRTDREEKQQRSHFVHVKAHPVEYPEEKAVWLAVGTRIVPRGFREFDAYHRLPVAMSFRLSGSEETTQMQIEAAAEGDLDEAGRHRVELLLRFPDTRDTGIFGLREEWFVNYSGPNYDLRVGDQGYGVSRLGSRYRYGRGIAVDYHPSQVPWGTGIYYINERWSVPHGQEFGAYVSCRSGQVFDGRVYFVRREADAWRQRKKFADTIWGFEAGGELDRNLSLEVAYGRCSSSREGARDDDGYKVDIDYQFGSRAYLRAGRVHAGPDFYGYYNNSQADYASLSCPLGQRARATVAYRNYRRNLDLRPSVTTAERERLWHAGLSYDLGHDWSLSFSYDDYRLRDAFAPPRYNFEERAFSVSLGRSADKWHVRGEIQAGRQRDRLTGRDETVWNYGLYGTYRPSATLFLSLYSAFGDDDALRRGHLLRGVDKWGGAVRWHPRADLRLEAWYARHAFEGLRHAEIENFHLGLEHQLRNGHWLRFLARRSHCELWGGETEYLLTYTMPLGVPVSRRRSVGSVCGRLYDAESSGARGIPGVKLYLHGAVATTDQEGRFCFRFVPPGTAHLRVDRASMGLERVATKGLPIAVEVRGGETAKVEIGIVRAAVVTGRVLVVPVAAGAASGRDAAEEFVLGAPGAKPSPVPVGLSNVLVELSNGQESVRRVTDRGGNFLFDSLPPGTWRLKIYDHNLPAYHYLENPEQTLRLEPGQKTSITIRVLPKARQIRFIDEGVIRAEPEDQ